jgi:molecular chaperone HscB
MNVAKNPFETLGVAPSFRLEARELEQRQRDLSKALHPDRHAAGTPAERRAALSEAINVNDAYRVLRDPVTRAEALFTLLGQPKGSEGETSAQLSPELLLGVMEQREELSSARRARDRAALSALVAKADKEQAELEALLGDTLEQALQARSFSNLSAPVAKSAASEAASSPAVVALALETAAQALARLRYVRKLLEEAAAVEDELDAN